jgi:Na+/H+-translocating membrane pyrophosphatase
MTAIAWSPVLGLLGLAMAFAMYYVLAQPGGTAVMVDISSQIHTGAMAFLRKE